MLMTALCCDTEMHSSAFMTDTHTASGVYFLLLFIFKTNSFLLNFVLLLCFVPSVSCQEIAS